MMRIKHLFLTVLASMILLASCEHKEENVSIPSMKVEMAELSFDVSEGSQTIQFIANRAWKAEWDADWIAVEPSSGEASNQMQQVTVSVLSNAAFDRVATIKFTMTYDYKTVTVSQKGESGSTEDMLIFYSDFDKEAATNTYGTGSSWPTLDQFEGWKNESGIGAGNITYLFNGITARNNSNSNGSYSDYPGSGVNNLFFGQDGYISMQDIDIENKGVNFTLTFGTEKYLVNAADNTFNPSEFHIYISDDNRLWTELTYSFTNGFKNGRWDLAKTTFTVPSGTTKLSLYFKSDLASAHRLDDVRLEASITSGTPIDFTTGIELGGNGGGGTEDIYFNNFDKEKAVNVSGAGWPFANSSDIYKNETGTGAANVTYTAYGMTIRSNSESNGNYSDYSGSGMNNMFFGTDNYFKIKQIALNNQTKFTLTFGAEKYLQTNAVFNPQEFHVYVGKDTLKWVELSYTFPNGYKDGRWDLATTTFSVPSGTSELYFYIKADVPSAYRLDDFRLAEAESSTQAFPVDFTQGISLDGDPGGNDPGGDEITYRKATTITTGKAYLLVTSDGKCAQPITNANGYGYMNVSNVSIVDDVITTTTDANEFVFSAMATVNGFTIQQKDGKYLYQTGTYNSFNVSEAPNDGQYWSVEISNAGEAKITNISVNKYIQYSAQHTSYGSYSTQTGSLPMLFERVDGEGGDNPGGGETSSYSFNITECTWSQATSDNYGSGFKGVYNIPGNTTESVEVAYYKHTATSNPIEVGTNDHIRIYKNSVLEIKSSSNKKIKSVELTATGTNYSKDMVILTDNNSAATAQGTTISWSTSSPLTPFVAHSVNAQVRIKSIKVEFVD